MLSKLARATMLPHEVKARTDPARWRIADMSRQPGKDFNLPTRWLEANENQRLVIGDLVC